ncbi:selenocysteine-specific translation elongation factor [Noviherbaspirillum pedocola]|uniref:Selenocysteine-specific elongation factor n=1 Tax=Noviherbaspirillum pedocola TaxID=2801341 RepID=A0A934W7M4_9BURK|nr:selenocysteine-specific translation elongation factor [Noviherbaspirillum pedocola]MBK4736555.1 selenocysteine-specific translation elongation factor [Noviherbaspirillum pedocola]
MNGGNAHLTLGVIGHVDHGKTSLVRALTGTDTDRLKEEKERGMSIVLGFAWLGFEEGIVDVIDVPGHEAFVRTMIAGATGIDAALLVVDAREGIKPQTLEHLAIIELIGVSRGVIAITKSDLVPGAERDALLRRLRMRLKGTPLEFAPAVATSIISGEGIAELKAALRGLLLAHEDAAPSLARGYLPIDRVFSLPGHGTIVTGTLRAGRIAIGEELELMPSGRRATVRQLEMHGREVNMVHAGQRVGVNLRHVKPQDVTRGDVLAAPGLLKLGEWLDAEIRVTPDAPAPIANGQTLRLLFGATDVAARVRLLGKETLAPGEAGLGQLRTARPVAAAAGEAFILRRESPAATLGGGRLLDVAAGRHRRGDGAVRQRLAVLARGRGDEALAERLRGSGIAGMPLPRIAEMLGCDSDAARAAIDGYARLHGATVLHLQHHDALCEALLACLRDFHRREPARAGAPLPLCRASLPREVDDKLFKSILRGLASSGNIAFGNGLAWLPGHDPFAALDAKARGRAEQIEAHFLQGGVTPPDVEDYTIERASAALFHMLVEQGRILLLTGQLPGQRIAFHREAIEAAKARIRSAYPAPARFTVSEARGLLGSTRKFTVPLLAHLDAAGFTRRNGDIRVLREGLQAGAAARSGEGA